MRKFVSARLRLGQELYIWGWRWAVFIGWGIPYGLAGAYSLLRSEGGERFLKWLSLQELLPNWLPTVWLIAGVVALFVITFEGAYRKIQKLKASEIEVSQRIDQRLLYLEILNKGQQPTHYTGRMVSVAYVKEGRFESGKELDYYLRWGNNESPSEPNWKELHAMTGKGVMNVARGDGLTIQGRSIELGDAALIKMLKAQGEYDIVADLDTVIEYSIEICAKPSFPKPAIYNFKIKRIKLNDPTLESRWEEVSELG